MNDIVGEENANFKETSSSIKPAKKRIPKVFILIGSVFLCLVVIGGIVAYLLLRRNSTNRQTESEVQDKEITGQAKNISEFSEGDKLLQTICKTTIRLYAKLHEARMALKDKFF